MSGAQDLANLSADLKTSGNRTLKNEMLGQFRKIARPAVEAVRISTGARLPQRGGFAHEVSTSKITARTTTTGRNVGVRIVAAGGPKAHDMPRIDSGKIRHPVGGNPAVWVEQQIPAGTITRPLEAMGPTVQIAMKHVMDDVARKLERG